MQVNTQTVSNDLIEGLLGYAVLLWSANQAETKTHVQPSQQLCSVQLSSAALQTTFQLVTYKVHTIKDVNSSSLSPFFYSHFIIHIMTIFTIRVSVSIYSKYLCVSLILLSLKKERIRLKERLFHVYRVMCRWRKKGNVHWARENLFLKALRNWSFSH